MAEQSAEERAALVVAAQSKASVAEHRRELATAVKLYERALALAQTLYEPDSLVFACSHVVLVPQRWNLAQAAGCSAAERSAQLEAALVNLSAGHDVLEQRRAARTLSTPRPDEAVFETQRRGSLRGQQAPNPFAPPAAFYDAMSQQWVPLFGFICVMWGALGCVAVLHGQPELIGAATTLRYQKALLAALDMWARVRASPDAPLGLSNQEIAVAEHVQAMLAARGARATPFGAALAAAWERPAVRDRLMSMGLPMLEAHMAQRYANEA